MQIAIGMPIGYPVASGKAAGIFAYLLNDTFTTDRAAGAVNGTDAEPGPGRRVVVDTEGKLSIAGGDLTPSGGKASPAYNDPYLYYAKARSAGKVAVFALNVPNLTTRAVMGFGIISPGTIQNTAIFLINAEIRADSGPGFTWVVVRALTIGEHKFAVVQRAVGGFHFQWVGGVPILLWVDNLETSGGAVGFGNYNATYTYHYLRVPSSPWLPTPLLSDGFSAWGTSDGLGHAEGVAGGLGSGGSGLTYTTTGTWGAAGGVASASALSSGSAIAYAETGKADVIVRAAFTRAGGDGGLLLRFADSNNFMSCRHDGTNVVLIKKVAGSNTTVRTTATTYVAGAEWTAVLDGTKVRIYYNNALVGAEDTVADAALVAATKHGLYTTNTGNTFDNFVAYARGTGGEFSALDAF